MILKNIDQAKKNQKDQEHIQPKDINLPDNIKPSFFWQQSEVTGKATM